VCGRFTITSPNEALIQMFSAAPANDLPEPPNYNVCPTNTVAAVTSDAGQRRLRPMRWGFLPRWYKTASDGPLIINARSETVAEKPAFREAVRTRRCLIPANGFYEWSEGPDRSRLPWYITRADGQPTAFAGLWQRWEREGEAIDTCAIVSTAAGPGMAGIHHREPVVVEPADWPLWLGEVGTGAAVLMRASAEGVLAAPYRVDPRVNSNRASGPELITPLVA
jgi:putative SOS response-associated peptidase YedK